MASTLGKTTDQDGMTGAVTEVINDKANAGVLDSFKNNGDYESVNKVNTLVDSKLFPGKRRRKRGERRGGEENGIWPL